MDVLIRPHAACQSVHSGRVIPFNGPVPFLLLLHDSGPSLNTPLRSQSPPGSSLAGILWFNHKLRQL